MSNTRTTTPTAVAGKSAAARKAEADGEDIPFDFEGHTYRLPSDVDIETIELADDNKYTKATRALLGDEQYEVFRSRHSKASELETFLNQAFEAMGGNS